MANPFNIYTLTGKRRAASPGNLPTRNPQDEDNRETSGNDTERSSPQSNTLTFKGYDDIRIPIIYGKVRTGGIIVYRKLLGDGRLLYVYLICWGPINSISDFRWGPAQHSNGPYNTITVNAHTGTAASNAAVDSLLTTHSGGEWTSRNPGLAYVVVLFPSTYSGASPPDPDDFTCVVEGALVRDHRTDPTLVNRYYRDDVANCRADFWTNQRYAGGRLDADIDWATIDEAANDCDVTLSLTPPSASLGAQTGNVDYDVRFSYSTIDGAGVESSLSPVSGTANANTPPPHYRVNVTVPVGPSGTASRKVYASGVFGAAPYRLVGTIADNVTTAFEYNMSNATWSAQPLSPSSPTTASSKAYRIGLKIDDVKDWEDWDRDIAMLAQIYDGYYNGKHQMFVDKARSASSIVLTDIGTSANIRKAELIDKNRSQMPDRVIYEYVDQLNDFKPGSAQTENPQIKDGLVPDPVIHRVSSKGCPSFDQAKRLSHHKYNHTRIDKEARIWTLWDGGVSCVPGLIITVTSSDLDWINQQALVLEVEDDEDFGFAIFCIPYNPNVYLNTIQSVETVAINQGTSSYQELAAPTGLVITPSTNEVEPGIFIPAIAVSWVKNPLQNVAGTQIKIQVNSGGYVDKGIFPGNGPAGKFIINEGQNAVVNVRAYSVEAKSGVASSLFMQTDYTFVPPAPEPPDLISTVIDGVNNRWYFDLPPVRSTTNYGAGSWSSSGNLVTFVAAEINDLDYLTEAIKFDTVSGTEKWVRVDLGSAIEIREIEIHWLDATGQKDGSVGLWPQYSDNDTDWTNVSTISAGATNAESEENKVTPAPSGIAFSCARFTGQGSHRYWRILKPSTGNITARISEIRFRSYTGQTFTDVRGYRITGWDMSSDQIPKTYQNVLKTVDIYFQPTSDNGIIQSQFQQKFNNLSILDNSGSFGSQRLIKVATISKTNQVSDNRAIHFSASIAAPGSTSGGLQQTYLPLAKEDIDITGGGTKHDLNISYQFDLIRLHNASAATSISGLQRGHAGRIIVIWNNSGQDVTLLHDNSGSSAANRIFFDDASNRLLPNTHSIVLVHNGTQWRISHTHPQTDIFNLVTDLAAKAPLASPALTGDPTAPTPSAGDNDTSISTTAFVQTATERGKERTKTLTDGAALADYLTITIPNLTTCALWVEFEVRAINATDSQTYSGTGVVYAAANSSGTVTGTYIGVGNGPFVQQSAGTLTVGWGVTFGTNTITLRVNADSSLSSTTITFRYRLRWMSAALTVAEV